MSAITATQEGRNLLIRVDGIDDPFVVKPLPGTAGHQITETFLRSLVQQADEHEMTDALSIALDGGVRDDDGRWQPAPAEHRTNGRRLEDEVRLGEAEDIAMAAFLWQTVLGENGVNVYLGSGGGVAGLSKATWALIARMGISPRTTSPSSALDDLTLLLGSTPSTSSLPAGAKPVKQPRDRLPRKARARKD